MTVLVLFLEETETSSIYKPPSSIYVCIYTYIHTHIYIYTCMDYILMYNISYIWVSFKKYFHKYHRQVQQPSFLITPGVNSRNTTKRKYPPIWPILLTVRKQRIPTSLLADRTGFWHLLFICLLENTSVNCQKNQQGLSLQHSLVFLRKPKWVQMQLIASVLPKLW